MESVVANLIGKARREMLNGREYVVAPLTLLVSGVLNGSKGPLYYPPEEINRDPAAWNGMPIVLRHPEKNGQPISGRSPDVWNKQLLGHVFHVTADAEGRLRGEGWFDVLHTTVVDDRVLAALNAGQPIELSTGLFTENELAPDGATHNGKAYTYVAKNYRPDHLAILPDEIGACSIKDGCGVLVNEDERRTLWQRLGGLLGITGNKKPGVALVGGDDYILKSKLHSHLHASGIPAMVESAKDGVVIYTHDGKTFKRRYKLADEAITWDDEPSEVAKIDGYYRKPRAAAEAAEGEATVNRTETIAFLVANCDCWKDETETLNKLSDVQLAKLKAKADQDREQAVVINAIRESVGDPAMVLNAMPEMIKKKIKRRKEMEENEGDEGEEGEEKAVKNASRLTLEEQEDLAFARAEKNRQKAILIERLTANAADDASKRAAATIYGKMTLEQLRPLAAVLPEATPVAETLAPPPNYWGAAPAVNQVKDDSDNVLPLVNVDFDEMASPRLRRKQA